MNLAGTITTYASELMEVLGEPTVGPNCDLLDKNSIEWHLDLDGESQVRDYKTYGITPMEMHTFFVYSTNPNAIDELKAKFKKARRLSAVRKFNKVKFPMDY